MFFPPSSFFGAKPSHARGQVSQDFKKGMVMAQAIETVYRGFRFRSRIEARWAVFFDTLGIEWEYEKEGYNLPSGPYLPDFWLPEQKMWAEVKGGDFTRQEVQKCRELSMETASICICLNGMPGRTFFAFDSIEDDGTGHDTWLLTIDLSRMPRNDGLWCDFAPEGQKPSFLGEKCPGVIAARSARFEHGEKGTR